jgi:alkylation response protein AidB-like acyl-CoA dehydrogenase
VRDAPTGSRAKVPWAQSSLGELRHWVRSGEQVIFATIDEIADEAMDPVERTDRMLLAMYHMRRMCEETALATFRLSGAHGYVQAQPIERMFRDLMGYIATAYKAPELVEHIGRAGLGLPFTLNATGG